MELLDFVGVGERLGVKPTSVRIRHYRASARRQAGKARDKDLPVPDFTVHGLPVWKGTTIDRWIGKMPGALGERYRQNGEGNA